jgi:hypothetical protein
MATVAKRKKKMTTSSCNDGNKPDKYVQKLPDKCHILPAYTYDCMWCHIPMLNMEGKLYCLQCKDASVGQCTECKMHYPYGYLFTEDRVCVGCDIKRRLKRAKRDHPPLANLGKEKKKLGPSLKDVIKKLESEKTQLCMDMLDLSKENRQLRGELRGELVKRQHIHDPLYGLPSYSETVMQSQM